MRDAQFSIYSFDKYRGFTFESNGDGLIRTYDKYGNHVFTSSTLEAAENEVDKYYAYEKQKRSQK